MPTNQNVTHETKEVPIPEMASAAVRARYPNLAHLSNIILAKEALFVSRKNGTRPQWVKLFGSNTERLRLEAEAEKIFLDLSETERMLRVMDRRVSTYKLQLDKLHADNHSLTSRLFAIANKFETMGFWRRLLWAFTHE